MDERPFASGRAPGLRRADLPARRAAALADGWTGLPEGVTRWRLAAALRAAARPLGLSGGMLRLIEHYIDLSYDQDWAPDCEPVVARPLAEIAEAMDLGERQVRNLERALVERGLLAFRDSGNHHRRSRRDRKTGRLLYAYGPSLAPAGARAAEIIAMADQARRAIAEGRRLRIALSALRRRIRVEVAAAEAAGLQVDDLAAQFAAIPDRAPGGAPIEALKARRDQLAMLALATSDRLGGVCPSDINDVEITCKPEISTPHLPDTSKSHAINGDCIAMKKAKADGSRGTPEDATAGNKRRDDHGLSDVPLALALAAAGPEVTAAARRRGAPSWRGLVEAARDVAPLLGVDQALWGEACGRLGRGGAALTVVILERGVARGPTDASDPVRRPDAYLRGLLARAEVGALHLDRSIRALAQKPVARDAPGQARWSPQAETRTP